MLRPHHAVGTRVTVTASPTMTAFSGWSGEVTDVADRDGWNHIVKLDNYNPRDGIPVVNFAYDELTPADQYQGPPPEGDDDAEGPV